MVTITIDNREIEALDGETVIAAARRHGIEIPHFCWHDKLSIAGNCRMCLVKVNNLPKLMPACNLVAAPKMVIETAVEQVVKARENVLQFILLNHPVDCGICDKAGECTLQDHQHQHGPAQSRSIDAKLHKRKLVELSPRISLDNERCILCSRCVRFTREISGSHALGIVERGHSSYVERMAGQPFDDPYSDNVIGICPVGALLSTDFFYQSRVWFLEPVRSTCNGCARGCSVQVWRRSKLREPRGPGAPAVKKALRTTALDNPAVNGPWLCNKGFDLHKAMAGERALQAQVDGRAVAPEQALAQASTLLAQARKPAVLLSAQASNEELDAFAAAFGALVGQRLAAYVREDAAPAPGEVVEDPLLIRADKNPNSRGLRERFGHASFDPAAGHDLVLVWGAWPGRAGLGDARVVHLTSFGPAWTPPADVQLPISTHFERSGSFTNFEGTRCSFEAVFDKPAGVLHADEVFSALAQGGAA